MEMGVSKYSPPIVHLSDLWYHHECLACHGEPQVMIRPGFIHTACVVLSGSAFSLCACSLSDKLEGGSSLEHPILKSLCGGFAIVEFWFVRHEVVPASMKELRC